MIKFSRYVVMFSKSYGHIGTLRSSYNVLHLTNGYKSNSFSVCNNYDNDYLIKSIRLRYYSAQPKKQSTNFSEQDKVEIPCKSIDNNDRTDTPGTSKGSISNIKDVSKLTEMVNGSPNEKDSNKTVSNEAKTVPLAKTKETYFQKFKKMYKDYWYVLLPVHVVTSAFWFGGFYYVATSGLDIPALMHSAGFSDVYINPLRDSRLGHIAIAYLLYKVATPLRYTVTLGGTTVAIEYLVKRGYIKPVPTKNEIIQKYKDHMILRRDRKNKN